MTHNSASYYLEEKINFNRRTNIPECFLIFIEKAFDISRDEKVVECGFATLKRKESYMMMSHSEVKQVILNITLNKSPPS